MSRILGIELRRSAALGAMLIMLVAGAVLLYSAPQRWSAGWMPLVMAQREYLVLLWPLALAAGAWQSRREHRSNVAELFASTARPGAQRMMPTLGAMSIAVTCAYLAMLAVGAVWIVDTAGYLPSAAFAVAAVGGLALVAAVWLGQGVGRLVPSLVTAPALAVAGIGLLMVVPSALRSREWLALVFSPMHGMGQYTDYQTVAGRVSTAQAIWLAALAVSGAVLLASGGWRTRVAALLPAALGATVAIMAVPRGEFVAHLIDPVAQEQVCAEGSPRVCVSRIHAGLLPEVTPLAREALAILAKLPDPPTTAHEDTTTYYPDTAPPRQADVVLIPIRVDKSGHLADRAAVVPRMLSAVGANTHGCNGSGSTPVSRAATHWLIGSEPVAEADESADVNAAAVTLWRGLRRLPEKEAAARVAAVRNAALNCEDIDGLLTRRAR